MKRIHFFLFAIILISIAAKVSFIPVREVKYAALSTEIKADHVNEFFKYKVNSLRFNKNEILKDCSIKAKVCCHA
ncbi:hypothetical protein [Christiangramia sp.]|uniref:hypothetical protein n=1 Tax=Christiangramia sp. TaxID=1931228 RepID=UPI002619129B|nr:hypothetical protein [Christiangramia sp.]